MKIGINGFGRIGRQVFRIAYEQEKLEVVHINDITDPETLAYLLQFDTTYGRWDHLVRAEGDALIIDDQITVSVGAEKDPAQLPWREKGAEVVLEAIGLFRKDTQLIGDRFVKVLAWYDNEWAFSRRCVDMMQRMT